MKRSPSQYALALYEALQDSEVSNRKKTISGFLKLLEKNRSTKLLRRILVQYEKVYLAKKGLRKVEIESARKLPNSVINHLESIFHSKVLISEKHNPELLAGLTLLLDDSLYIDASAKTKINSLFE